MRVFAIVGETIRSIINDTINHLSTGHIWDSLFVFDSFSMFCVFIMPLFIVFMVGCTGVKKDIPRSYTPTSLSLHKEVDIPIPEEIKTKKLKLMTYNIRHGVGIDNSYDLDRIIDVIKGEDPDIVALNEVDHMMPRSYMHKQDKIIAESTGYNVVYGYNMNIGSKYGNVLLSKHPIMTYKNHILPKNMLSEPKGLLEADIYVDEKILKVFSTHLSVISEERPKQIEYIKEKLGGTQEPKVLMGDFNALPDSDEIKKIVEIMIDTAKDEYVTFSVDNPSARIDYIFVSEDIESDDSKIVKTEASDHFPVIAEIIIKDE